MLETTQFSEVGEILRPESFYDPQNRDIFAAMQALSTENKPIDMLTVVERLRLDGKLDKVGGAYRISQLTAGVTSGAHALFHARIVAQKFLARELIEFACHIERDAFDQGRDIDDVMQEAEGKLFEISQRNIKRDVVQIDRTIEEAIDAMAAAKNQKSGLSGLPSGFTDLDAITSGWQRSDLIIIAARPAMGKTAFVLSMARNMAVDHNIPVAVFSLEMSRLQLVNRIIQNQCEIDGDKIKSGNIKDMEWDMLMTHINALKGAPFYIDDTGSLSVFELRTKARRLVREHQVQMIIIDYLQLMNASGMKFGSREQEVSTISRNLKQLAKELNIPIVALSQLNRSIESRGLDSNQGKRPQLSDLRESGAIEQDADIVCFIHRPEYYLRSGTDAAGNDVRGVAEFYVAKHRSGKVGDIKLKFESNFARFQNWAASAVPQMMGSSMNDPVSDDGLPILLPGNPFQGGSAMDSLTTDSGEAPF